MNENDELSQLETKIIRKVYVWVVVGALGAGSVGSLGWGRYDKFGHSDAALMEQDLKHRIEYSEWSIRKDMPPLATRRRILDIERCLERNCTDFFQESQEW